MKALSIRAPWWWYILHGNKRIENRGRASHFRGIFLIHASTWWGKSEILSDIGSGAFQMSVKQDGEEQANLIYQRCLGSLEDQRAKGGHIVGIAEMTACLNEEFQPTGMNPFFVGPYGYKLENVVPLEKPYPVKGALGLFSAPASAEVAEYLLAAKAEGKLSEGQVTKILELDRLEVRKMEDDRNNG